MKTRYTRRQINEAISYWKECLKKDYGMTDAEIDEGLLTKVANAAKSAGVGISRTAKKVGAGLHDLVFANQGVKQLADVIKKIGQAFEKKSNGKKFTPAKILLQATMNGKTMPIVDFDHDKDVLVFTVDPKAQVKIAVNNDNIETNCISMQPVADEISDGGKKRAALTSLFKSITLAQKEPSSPSADSSSSETGETTTKTVSEDESTSTSSSEPKMNTTPVKGDGGQINVIDGNKLTEVKYEIKDGIYALVNLIFAIQQEAAEQADDSLWSISN